MKLYFKEVAKSILSVKPDKRNECFNWGLDNAFPSLVEALIGMSVTAKSCVDRVAKAIFGSSFGDAGKIKVNSAGQTLNELLRIAARWYAKQNNVFIHVSYDGNFDIKTIRIIPTTSVRIGKADDKGYSGKFLVYDNWDKTKMRKIMPTRFKAYDKYNPDKKVIEDQIKKAGTIESYNGQIIHIQKDEGVIYSLPDVSPVLSELVLENSSQTFRSRGARKGFLNNKLLVVPPFTGSGSDDNDVGGDARKDFKETIDSLQGAENSGDILLLETSQMTDDVSKQIVVSDLTGAYNDKLFEYSDKQAEKNICKSTIVPLVLVDTTDTGSFGDSGGKLREAKLQLWESREEDRYQFETVFNELASKFVDKPFKEDLEIINPYEIIEPVTEPKP